MSIIVRTGVEAVGSPLAGTALLLRALRMARAILAWPARVHANRKLLHLMAGMSAHELADIGLTPSDLRDTGALSLNSDVGHFLSARSDSRRRAPIVRRSSRR
ncbi:DUF1127 domain-containing protein [Lichenihabitans sp. Uapishka_5]|uniref:DUF1127 domain-containing protein n=1 Tax=Lichenihabitans sp. Uapishka_5 TaxID=3037302 RepID=UPI0029E7D1D5|nr:DUF1127 domain-containing protein [Lichenihabitans sp. Uapishka_5]MDX7951372.1 DUF1127 domain-containing protein [Lichenihabitans sp. Uapishka_5]